jgi:hypothetical protein
MAGGSPESESGSVGETSLLRSLTEDLGQLSLAFSFCIDRANSAGRDKSQNQRGRNTKKEDIFTNPLPQGRKVL